MAKVRLRVNGDVHHLDVSPDMPLLWVLRDILGLTGTKYGCGAQLCGACTVLLDGEPIRTCVRPAATIEGAITTIEGLGAQSPQSLHPVQRAFEAEQVPQCGYCQSGQVLAAVALLERTPDPSDAQIDDAFRGHVCRCGTYIRIRRAVKRAAGSGSTALGSDRR